MKLAQDRLDILKKIEELERNELFDLDVELDPPGKELLPHQVDYLNTKIKSKISSKYAFYLARRFMKKAIKNKQLIIKEIRGIENLNALDEGAILTCNHFSPLDSFIMQIAFEASNKKKTQKFWRVIKEGNYTSFPGFYGLLMRNCQTLPLSSNFTTMKKFVIAVRKALSRKDLILIYPEQSMWWNYKKPKPLKSGAFKLAYQNKAPVIPCFITMEDSEFIGADGFPIQEFTVHIEKPLYFDQEKSLLEATNELASKNFQVWKKIYEETYKIPLVYLKKTD